MKIPGKGTSSPDKTLAAVCGLYCGACTLYIATVDDPARLTSLAGRLKLPEETLRCFGCRSGKRWPYCEKCKMSACAAGKGIDFCALCAEYPCKEMKEFQAEKPHRIELWDDLKRIRSIGYEAWLCEIRARYACPQCETINSAYDHACRKCGGIPSCAYAEKHKKEIEQYLMEQNKG